MDSTTIGQRLRALRLAKDLSQADLARQLTISPAYLNLLEKGRRTMQFPLLLRALELLGADLEKFMAEASGARPEDALAHLLDDPLADTLALDEADLARMRAEPRVATTIAALYHLYKNARAQLDVALTKLEAGTLPPIGYAPGDEVSDFLEAHKNYFPELEAAADEIHARARLPRRFPADALVAVLAEQFGITASIDAPRGSSSVVRTFDVERRTLWLSADLADQALKFQLAHVIGLEVLARIGLTERLIAAAPPRHAETPRLIRIHLANYFAGALLLPYGEFFAEVQRTRYDVAKLVALFGSSWEAVAHRMCNLGDPRRPGVPLHFLRVDAAGNISKRYSASGMRFPHGHGSCPKWAVHAAFMTPALITKQYSQMPDGTTYFCFAKVISQPQAGSLVRGVNYAIGLGTGADNARHMVYADELSRAGDKAAVPVGVTCRFCERTDCSQRAAPSYKFALAIDENVKKDNFFSPLVEADRESAASPPTKKGLP
ncbi:MAG TPA: short-chain fatty acyl-CoA regulator family protein [Kofleriaceae bacterium]|jgi:predicted transcriptional regulator/DNA-binding XRE family transcriptional regulator|nr:short-chain fatty acyl-CoA regulator family protein [Kofleriaceae bacterium]